MKTKNILLSCAFILCALTSVAQGNPAPTLSVPPTGKLKVVIEIPANSECNGIALKGTFDGANWSGANTYLGEDGAQTPVDGKIYKFAAVSGYANWFQIEIPSSDALQFKVCLIYKNDGSWQGQGEGVELHSCNFSNIEPTIDGGLLKGFNANGGLIYLSIGEWNLSECYEYPIYPRSVTLIVPLNMCGFEIPSIVGSFNQWHLTGIPMRPVVEGLIYTANVDAHWRDAFRFCGSISGWDNEPNNYYPDKDEFSRTDNFYFGNDESFVVDLSDGRWSACFDKPTTNKYQLYKGGTYSVNVSSSDNKRGKVKVFSQISSPESVVLVAINQSPYRFAQWSDGNTDNPRIIKLTKDESFVALFTGTGKTITTNSNNPDWGTTAGDKTVETYGEKVEISAVANYGYHFVCWNDGNTDNPRIVTVFLENKTYTATFAKNTYSIKKITNPEQGTISGSDQAEYLDKVTFEAVSNRGYKFIQWKDGVKDNPRTIELTQDTTMEAIFDYLLEGKCGKDNVLTWTLDLPTKTLNIKGKGALSDNYTYGTFVESVTIGNEVTVIGKNAFYGCDKLKNVIIGSSVKVLEEYAFYNCVAIQSITCYSQRPPTVDNYALYGLDYSTVVYVPSDYLSTYKMHDAWGLYDVRPLGATSAETTDMKVAPTETTAAVTWPSVENAATYELVIKDKSGNIVCTLIFNANGQLTQIAFSAPARDNATQASGFSFTVTGLEEGTAYDLTITAKDSNGTVIQTTSQSFTTAGATGLDNTSAALTPHKVLRKGKVLILRDGKTYTVQGQQLR